MFAYMHAKTPACPHTRAHPESGWLPIYDQKSCVGSLFTQAGEWHSLFCRPEMQGPICQWRFRFTWNATKRKGLFSLL